MKNLMQSFRRWLICIRWNFRQIKEFMGEFEGKQIRSDIAIQKAVDLIVNSTVEK